MEAINKIVEKERESIAKAATLLADKIAGDPLIYVIGTGGHSSSRCLEAVREPGRFERIGGVTIFGPSV